MLGLEIELGLGSGFAMVTGRVIGTRVVGRVRVS